MSTPPRKPTRAQIRAAQVLVERFSQGLSSEPSTYIKKLANMSVPHNNHQQRKGTSSPMNEVSVNGATVRSAGNITMANGKVYSDSPVTIIRKNMVINGADATKGIVIAESVSSPPVSDIQDTINHHSDPRGIVIGEETKEDIQDEIQGQDEFKSSEKLSDRDKMNLRSVISLPRSEREGVTNNSVKEVVNDKSVIAGESLSSQKITFTGNQVTFQGAIIKDCSFEFPNSTRVVLQGCTLTNTKLVGSKTKNTILLAQGCIMTKAHDVGFAGSQYQGCIEN